MRFDGKLEEWDDDRGSGLIAPTRGGDPVYVHISAFQADGRRPRIGEFLTFEIDPTDDAKRRAINVQRPGHKQLRTTHTPEPRHGGRGAGPSWLGVAVAVLLVFGGVYAYTQFSARDTPHAATDPPSSTPGPLYSAPAATSFKCDGRTRCSQMTSCEEATFFLTNCPGTQMDATDDGIACEKHWCGGGRGR